MIVMLMHDYVYVCLFLSIYKIGYIFLGYATKDVHIDVMLLYT